MGTGGFELPTNLESLETFLNYHFPPKNKFKNNLQKMIYLKNK